MANRTSPFQEPHCLHSLLCNCLQSPVIFPLFPRACTFSRPMAASHLWDSHSHPMAHPFVQANATREGGRQGSSLVLYRMGGVVGPGGQGKVRRDVQERAKECYAEAECWVARKGRCSWGVDCVKQEIETSRAIGRRRLHRSAVEEWMVGGWQVDAGQEARLCFVQLRLVLLVRAGDRLLARLGVLGELGREDLSKRKRKGGISRRMRMSDEPRRPLTNLLQALGV